MASASQTAENKQNSVVYVQYWKNKQKLRSLARTDPFLNFQRETSDRGSTRTKRK